mgnify:CR=1 FL=1
MAKRKLLPSSYEVTKEYQVHKTVNGVPKDFICGFATHLLPCKISAHQQKDIGIFLSYQSGGRVGLDPLCILTLPDSTSELTSAVLSSYACNNKIQVLDLL